MGRGIFEKLLNSLENKGDKLPDNRNTGYIFRYRIGNALKCAFAVFFFQHQSILDYQRRMQERHRLDNAIEKFMHLL